MIIPDWFIELPREKLDTAMMMAFLLPGTESPSIFFAFGVVFNGRKANIKFNSIFNLSVLLTNTTLKLSHIKLCYLCVILPFN